MQPKTIMLILGAVVCSVAGQLLLKTGAQNLSSVSRFDFLLAAARSPYILAGVSAWVGSTVCWLYVLQSTPLSRAYGLNSLTYILTPLAAVFFFGEPMGRLQLVGTGLIVMGVACLLIGD